MRARPTSSPRCCRSCGRRSSWATCRRRSATAAWPRRPTSSAQLARRWELTLWASGLSEIYHEPTVEQPEQIDIRTIPLLPLSFDAAWFYSRNGGLIASFYFDYGDFVPLGVIYSLDTRLDKAASTNLFLLPGLGVTYRTLARISAQFATVAYFGPVHVAADDAIAGVADAGEDVWTWYFMMSFSSALAWNITQRLSLKTRVSVSLDMMTHVPRRASSRGGYSPGHLQFFTLGVAWRRLTPLRARAPWGRSGQRRRPPFPPRADRRSAPDGS